MLSCLLVLPPRLINPRFYRTHFLTALGLACMAWLFLEEVPPKRDLVLNDLLLGSMVLAFAGSFVWSLEGAPAGKTMILLTTLTLLTALGIVEFSQTPGDLGIPALTAAAREGAGFASAVLLGTALTAMLMGHSYLIAPSMSLVPLLRLIALLGGALLVRGLIEGARLSWWTSEYGWGMLDTETRLWLPVRWGVGLFLPLILGAMAWQTTRIRSTQSSTGILYVVVIFCFLGELTSMLLRPRGVTL